MRECVAVMGSREITETPAYREAEPIEVHTKYGPVELALSRDGAQPVVWLSRGGNRSTAAHAINHRANFAALEEFGVKRVLATAMVGSLDARMPIGTVLILDQFLDFAREPGFHQDDAYRDFDMTEPYCPVLREQLLDAACRAGTSVRPQGCYVGVRGPRFETAAEVRMYGKLGGDVVGMTGTTECIMAHEAGMCYGSVAAVVNLGAGLSRSPLSAESFKPHRVNIMPLVLEIIDRAVSSLGVSEPERCPCLAEVGTR